MLLWTQLIGWTYLLGVCDGPSDGIGGIPVTIAVDHIRVQRGDVKRSQAKLDQLQHLSSIIIILHYMNTYKNTIQYTIPVYELPQCSDH